MHLRPWPLAAVVVTVAVSGCSSNPAASPTARRAPAESAISSPSASPTAVATAGVTVVATGAAASPTGTLVFVVVDNASPVPVSNVAVTAVAASGNGGAPLQGNTVITNLGSGESQAAVIPLTVPSGDSLGAVTASAHAIGQSTYRNPLLASAARFIADPISPSISVSVAATTSVSSAVIVVVCWAASTIVGGAIKRGVAVAAGGAQTVTMQAALTTAPDSCSGYARPE
jgi:hypothetical protein